MVSEAQQLQFKVERRTIRLIPGRLLALSESGGDQKEVIRTQALPLGKARNELVSYPLPWMHHAAPEEFKDLFMMMRESAKATPAYLTLMVIHFAGGFWSVCELNSSRYRCDDSGSIDGPDYFDVIRHSASG